MSFAILHRPVAAGQPPASGDGRGRVSWRTCLREVTFFDPGAEAGAAARGRRGLRLPALGSRCYGSEVRRHLNGVETVALVGAGRLAAELLPYVAEGRVVDQGTRRDITVAGVRAACSSPAAIVIAAPVSNEAVEQIASCYPRLVRVIDLRSAEERQPFPGGLEVVTLDNIFAAVKASAAASEARLADARRDIAELAVAFERRQLLRPFGWDDLCA